MVAFGGATRCEACIATYLMDLVIDFDKAEDISKSGRGQDGGAAHGEYSMNIIDHKNLIDCNLAHSGQCWRSLFTEPADIRLR